MSDTEGASSDAAAQGTHPARAPEGALSPARSTVFRRLLAEDDSVRERALAHARSRRWFDAGSPSTIIVLGGPEPAAARRLATALQADGRGAVWHIGDVAGVPVVVVSTSRLGESARAWVDGAVRRHGADGIVVRTTEIGADEGDLAPAVSEVLGDLEADGAQLPGAIRQLIDRVDVPTALLRRASPGAFALWRSGDMEQRRTVEVYLDAGARVSEACRRLHIHRTTLYYRLENLPEEVREELADGLRRSVLHIVLTLLRERSR
ncbi:helix-turn-helix domain-containing protein [Microbacterium gilvum]|uniref:PucR C-terminal helix-turn-helix domain-containing protein n=1 Tax=Microbacterium gilvum TaxID=1336204 RepID=A0ABP8ZU10_9MICO